MCETPSFVTTPPTSRYYTTKGLRKNKTLPRNKLRTIEKRCNDVRKTKFVKLEDRSAYPKQNKKHKMNNVHLLKTSLLIQIGGNRRNKHCYAQMTPYKSF